MVGLSESAVKRTLKVLVDAKIVAKRARVGRHNGKKICVANEYLLVDVPLTREKSAQHPPRKS
jgi:predicted transcriptional regulator